MRAKKVRRVLILSLGRVNILSGFVGRGIRLVISSRILMI